MQQVSHVVGLMFGGNLGPVKSSFLKATDLLSEETGKIIAQSSLYITDPWGKVDQPVFYNQALLLETLLDPLVLLNNLKEIENSVGRIKSERNGPRLLDIDILFYDDYILNTEELILPHPRMHKRNFNLLPLQEVLPLWRHPLLNLSIDELIKISPDHLRVRKNIADA
jgi:2-amino-4-hydroxy-6-hydroxymethyldihydropteridine diphosphokinase